MDLACAQSKENAFVRRIFDKNTGKRLICRLHEGTDSEAEFGLTWWSTDTIPYDDVMKRAVNALQEEQRKAVHAEKMLETTEAAREKSFRMEDISRQARVVFDEMAEIVKPETELYQMMEKRQITEAEYAKQKEQINQQLSIRETSFAEIMEKANKLNKAFDRRNPWIKLYANIEIPNVLTKEQVKKWIGRLTVEDLSIVELTIPQKYIWWKEQLPPEWMEEME